ncbi:MAG: PAS domain S-box protein [Coleofasciculaceae cyanobacterium]
MQYLDKSDTRLKLALQCTNSGMWEWNSGTAQITWSEDFEQLLGVTPGSLKASYRSLLKLIVPADRQTVLQAIATAIKKQTQYTIKFRICPADGIIRYFTCQGEATSQERSNQIKVTGICQNITQSQTESQRLEDEAYQLALSNLTPDASFRLSREGIFLDFRSGKDVELLTPPTQFIGKSLLAVMPPEIAHSFQHYLQQALTTNHAIIFEYSSQVSDKLQYFEARLIKSAKDEVVVIVRNITERKLTEAALIASEQRLNSILNSLEDAVWSIAVESFQLLYLNPAAEAIFGRPSSEFLANPNLWLEIIHPEDRDRVWTQTRQLFETGNYQVEYRIIRPDGEIRHLRDRTRLIYDHQGNPNRLDGIANDITASLELVAALEKANAELENRVQERTAKLEQVVEQLRSEIAEREQAQAFAERLTTILEATPDAVGITDAVGKPLYLNRSARTMFGIDETEDLSISQNPASSLLPMPIPTATTTLASTEGTDLGIWSGETTWHHHEGRAIPVSQVIMSHKSPSGEIEFISTIARDITESKQAEAALAQSEAKWRSLIQNSSDLITILSSSGKILYTSPAIERILGYSPSELIGSEILQYIANEDKEAIAHAWDEFLAAAHGVTLPPVVCRFRCQNQTWCLLESCGTNLLADPAVAGIVINSRDLTDRFKVQEALRQSEVRFRAIFENAALGIALSDPSGVLLASNPAMQALIGYNENELRQVRLTAITHPDDQGAGVNLYQQLISGSINSYQLEKRYFHKNGRLVWGRLTVSLVRDKAGSPLFSVAMIEDITAAKETESALLRISKAVENASDAISIADSLVSSLTYLNPAFCQMFGYTIEQLNNAGGSTVLFCNPTLVNQVYRIAARGQGWQGEVEMLSRRGVIKQIALRADAIKDVTGEVVGVIAIHTDITEQKQAEAALRRSYHRAELLKQITTEIRSSLDLSHIFETTVTQLGQALKVNRCLIYLYQAATLPTLPLVAEYLEPGYNSVRYCEMLMTGYPCLQQVLACDQAIASTDIYTESLSDSTAKLYRAMDLKSLLIIRTSYQGEPNGMIALQQCDTYRHWDSTEIELLEAVAAQVGIALAQASLLEKETTTAAQLAQQNLALQLSRARANTKATELEQALRELQRTQAQLIQTEKMSSLGQLVAGVAHEINNPVSLITGNIGYACEYIHDLLGIVNLYQQCYPQPLPLIQERLNTVELDFLIKDLLKLLNSMKVGADRVNQIVLSLRNFARNEEKMAEVDLHEGIDNTLMILQSRLKANGKNPEIKIIKEYAALPLVECYAGPLNQVFMNLISNAIDALESFGVGDKQRIDPTITICTEAKGNSQVIIRIIDNGMGMTEEVQKRLFNPFFTTKPVGKGTGLGLSISYQIVVEKHGGELQCFSAPGQGTQFIIDIPLRHPKAEN